jgi:hypothetical protein
LAGAKLPRRHVGFYAEFQADNVTVAFARRWILL